jgi:hypothetical protein
MVANPERHHIHMPKPPPQLPPGRRPAHPRTRAKAAPFTPLTQLRRLAGAGVKAERRAHKCESLADSYSCVNR